MPAEFGPFSSERDAMSTQAAARIRAACDARPATWRSEHLKVMTDACAEAGVELGSFDLAPLRQLANYEPFNAVVLAGIIHRAFKAGQAAGPPGAVTEWGACRRNETEPFTSGDEEAVRNFAADLPNVVTGIMRRRITSWEAVPDE